MKKKVISAIMLGLTSNCFAMQLIGGKILSDKISTNPSTQGVFQDSNFDKNSFIFKKFSLLNLSKAKSEYKTFSDLESPEAKLGRPLTLSGYISTDLNNASNVSHTYQINYNFCLFINFDDPICVTNKIKAELEPNGFLELTKTALLTHTFDKIPDLSFATLETVITRDQGNTIYHPITALTIKVS